MLTRREAWLILGGKNGLKPQANNLNKPASHRQLWALNMENDIEATAAGRAKLLAAESAANRASDMERSTIDRSTVAGASKEPGFPGPSRPPDPFV